MQRHHASLANVLGNAHTTELQRTQMIKRLGDTLTGGAIEPVGGRAEFLWQARSERVRAAQLIGCSKYIPVRRTSDPTGRFGGITRHALAAHIKLSEGELRFTVTQVGRLATHDSGLTEIRPGTGTEQMRQRQQRPDVSLGRGTPQPRFRLGRIGLDAVPAHEQLAQVIHRRGLTGFS